MFENDIEKLRDEIVSKTCRLIQIPSVYENSTDSNMPFGKNVNKALNYMLSLGEDLGFRTKNIDGYCGYIEFGQGEELIGIVGHLDVVPEGDNWTYEPFSGTIREGKLYGRGAIDDKGPVIASLYAMKTVMDNTQIHKRVRLILGLNEERDWKCIDYYKAHEELPSISFSPDADFPCIYAEKGILSVYLQDDYTQYLNQPIIIKNIDCKGNALNVVPKECSITIKINNAKIDIDLLIQYIQNVVEKYSFDFKIEKIDDFEVQITSYGISAHAAHPQLGTNAISRLLVVLYDVFSYYNTNIGILHLFKNYINTEYYGTSLGINIEDESGKLTLNVGDFSLDDSLLKIGFNIRIPIKTQIYKIENKFKELAKQYKKITVEATDHKEPLYVPKDDFLVTTLCHIFNKITGLQKEPVAIGGATYARAFDNCVSFGANMPGNKDMCHQTDEFISIEDLILSSKIYAEAIYELSK